MLMYLLDTQNDTDRSLNSRRSFLGVVVGPIVRSTSSSYKLFDVTSVRRRIAEDVLERLVQLRVSEYTMGDLLIVGIEPFACLRVTYPRR
jgi:hypothetical protein